MSTTTLREMYVGLDVHKDTITVAVADANGREARLFGTIDNNTAALERLLRMLSEAHPGRRWIFAYGAGPRGYPLARRLRAGELTAVCVPDEEVEALRDLSRAREDLLRNERRLRQNLSGLLLRHECVYRGSEAWTQKHGLWLDQQHFAQAHTELAFQGYRQSLVLAEHQRRELERLLIECAQSYRHPAKLTPRISVSRSAQAALLRPLVP